LLLLLTIGNPDDGQAPEQQQPQPAHVQAFYKLPPYWPNNPRVWFAQVEAQFSTHGIAVQRTMFDYVVANLTPDIAIEIRGLILRPPEESYSHNQPHFNYNRSQYQHQTLHYFVTCLLVFLALMYHNNIASLCLILYIHYHTQASVPPNV